MDLTLDGFDVGVAGGTCVWANLNGTYQFRTDITDNGGLLPPPTGWTLRKITIDLVDSSGNPTVTVDVFLEVAVTCGTGTDPPTVSFVRGMEGTWPGGNGIFLVDYSDSPEGGRKFAGSQSCGTNDPHTTVTFQTVESDRGNQAALPEECLPCCGIPRLNEGDTTISTKMLALNFQNLKIYGPDQAGTAEELKFSQLASRDPFNRPEAPCAVNVRLDTTEVSYAVISLPVATGLWEVFDDATPLRFPIMVADPSTVTGPQEARVPNATGTDQLWRATWDVVDPTEVWKKCQPNVCCGLYVAARDTDCPIQNAVFYGEDDRWQPGPPRQRRRVYSQTGGRPAGDCRWVIETQLEEEVHPGQGGQPGPDIPVLLDFDRWEFEFEWGISPTGYFFPEVRANTPNGTFCAKSAGSSDGWNRVASVEFEVAGMLACALDELSTCVEFGDPDCLFQEGTSVSMSVDLDAVNAAGQVTPYTGVLSASGVYEGRETFRGSGTVTSTEDIFDPAENLYAPIPQPSPGIPVGVVMSPNYNGVQWYWDLNLSPANAYAQAPSGFRVLELTARPLCSSTFDIVANDPGNTVVGSLTVTEALEGCTPPAGLGRVFRQTHPGLFSRCGTCQSAMADLVNLMNAKGLEATVLDVSRWAQELARVKELELDQAVQAITETIRYSMGRAERATT